MRFLLLPAVGVAVLGMLLGVARAEEGPFVVLDASAADAVLPRGQGATVTRVEAEGKGAAQVEVAAGSAWARIYFRDVPTDVRPFTELEITLKGAASGALQEVQIQLADGQDRNALLKLAAPKTTWETRRVRLADAVVPPGFDPAAVKMLLFNWYKPLQGTLLVARVAFLRGEGGWRLSNDELVAKVFGEKRAKEAKLEATAHFDVWSDAPQRTVKTLGEDLEKEASAAAGLFGLGPEGLTGFRMPAYAFKSPGDYREYCTRVLGWNEEQARRRPATGTAGEVVLTIQGGPMPDRAHRVARAVFAHAFGSGGGAWLQDGAGELTVRSMEGKQVTKELQPRLKSTSLWSLKSLVGAEALYGGGTNTAATYDYRPVFTHAATVVEFLIRRPPAGPATAGATPADRVRERLKALGAVRSRGAARVADVERILGQSLEEFEAAWKEWVLGAAK